MVQSKGSKNGSAVGSGYLTTRSQNENKLQAKLSGVLKSKMRGSFTNLNKHLDIPNTLKGKRQHSYIKNTSPLAKHKEYKKNS